MTDGWSASIWPNVKPPALFYMKPDQKISQIYISKRQSINEDSVLEPTRPIKRGGEKEQRKTEWTKKRQKKRGNLRTEK